jgi:hypothetical protein
LFLFIFFKKWLFIANFGFRIADWPEGEDVDLEFTVHAVEKVLPVRIAVDPVAEIQSAIRPAVAGSSANSPLSCFLFSCARRMTALDKQSK